MDGLSIHGSTQVTEEMVRELEAPQATPSWNPISHNVFLDIVFQSMDSVGFKIGQTQYGVSKDGSKLFGTALVPNVEINDKVGAVLGFRNSTDKSFAAAACFGSSVFVCDNMCFSGEVVVKRKHSAYITRDLPPMMIEAISGLSDAADTMRDKYAQYEDIKINDEKANNILVEAAIDDVISYSAIQNVHKEWMEPSHEEFKPRTAWSLHNAFTEVFRQKQEKRVATHSNPFYIPAQSLKLNSLFDAHLKYAASWTVGDDSWTALKGKIGPGEPVGARW